jgi:hypothetical protein
MSKFKKWKFVRKFAHTAEELQNWMKFETFLQLTDSWEIEIVS